MKALTSNSFNFPNQVNHYNGKVRDVYNIGNEKLVISVDHNDGLIVVNGWQQTTKISLIDAVNDFRKMGFSEYLSTSIVRDGTLNGPDLEPLKMVNQIENVKEMFIKLTAEYIKINHASKGKEIRQLIDDHFNSKDNQEPIRYIVDKIDAFLN